MKWTPLEVMYDRFELTQNNARPRGQLFDVSGALKLEIEFTLLASHMDHLGVYCTQKKKNSVKPLDLFCRIGVAGTQLIVSN